MCRLISSASYAQVGAQTSARRERSDLGQPRLDSVCIAVRIGSSAQDRRHAMPFHTVPCPRLPDSIQRCNPIARSLTVPSFAPLQIGDQAACVRDQLAPLRCHVLLHVASRPRLRSRRMHSCPTDRLTRAARTPIAVATALVHMAAFLCASALTLPSLRGAHSCATVLVRMFLLCSGWSATATRRALQTTSR